jgi:hypothetical protein
VKQSKTKQNKAKQKNKKQSKTKLYQIIANPNGAEVKNYGDDAPLTPGLAAGIGPSREKIHASTFSVKSNYDWRKIRQHSPPPITYISAAF